MAKQEVTDTDDAPSAFGGESHEEEDQATGRS